MGPIMEHLWATSFFATEANAALAKAAEYKDVADLQARAPGLFLRLLTRVRSRGACASVTDGMLTALALLL